MRVLVIGAGVIGSLYGARLALAGHEVTILARGRRYQDIATGGLIIEEARHGRRETASVSAISELDGDDRYDLTLVSVRNNQVASVLPLLERCTSPAVLFMVNSAEGPEKLANAIGASRLLLGFPGAGGTCVDGIVRYTIVHPVIQMTTVGESQGDQVTERVRALVEVFRQAGFPSAPCRDMDAWLKTHVAVVSPIANAVYAKDGDLRAAANDRALMRTCALALKENLRAVEASGVSLTPGRFGLLRLVPTALMARVAGMLLDTDYADLVVARHANNARDEMGELARQVSAIATAVGVQTPSADALAAFI
ncbi:MAG: ketopantoate reductase family protein [Actinobacteria bacterium]|nr:MAG: ketopantoate reductase family protein [Actinomycetota bacterium]